MLTRPRTLSFALLLTLVVGCTAPTPGRTGSGGQPGAPPGPPKRVVVSIMDDPPTLSDKLGPPSIRGADALEELIHVGLATLSNDGFLTPRLAEAVPTLENGLWRVFPDGKMETTWRLREGVAWQDGAPFTTEDLEFTARVARD